LVNKIGAGPKGVSIAKLSEKKIEPLLLDLFTNKLYKQRAKEISNEMNEENFEEDLYKLIIN